jgi:hypothetical protein
MKAFKVYWNPEDGTDECQVCVIAQSVREVIPAFEKALPDKNIEHIKFIEVKDEVVVFSNE